MSRGNFSSQEIRNLRTLLLVSPFASQEIGARIKQARNELGMTQDDLADLLGVSMRSVQGWEAGDHVPFRRMQEISELLKRPVPWLLHGDATEEDEGGGLGDRLEAVEARLEHVEELVQAVLVGVQRIEGAG